MAFLHIHRLVAGGHLRLAIVNAQFVGVGVEPVDTLLHRVNGGIPMDYSDGVILPNIFRFHHRGAREELQASIDQAVGNHAERAVLADTQKNAGGQQHFRASLLGFELLVFLYFRKNAEFGFHQLVAHVNLAFHVVDQPGARRDHRRLGQGGNTASRKGRNAKS